MFFFLVLLNENSEPDVGLTAVTLVITVEFDRFLDQFLGKMSPRLKF